MKQLFRFSILLLALLLPALATAHDFEVDSIYYNRINDNEVEVTYGQIFDHRYQYHGAVTIPATVTYDGTTYSVTAIGEGAFLRCSGLASVDIPNSVTSIGRAVFYNCTGLTSIVIPNSVTSIGQEAFYNCTGLTSIDIPNSVTAIGAWAFDNTAWYNNQPDGLVYAGMVAYKYKGTMPSGTNMTLKEGTLGIAVYAFEGCTGLASVVMPNSVTEIGVLAFMDCPGLTSIVVESGNPRYDSRNNCNAIIETASNTLIVGCMNTIIPNSVTAIGASAFSGCSGLTSIVIPNSVTSIGYYAFAGCTGLTSIDIPNSVTSVDPGAFYDTAWYNNQPDGLVYVGLVAYEYKGTMPSGTNITLKEGTIGISGEAFYRCAGLTGIVIPNSVTSIGDEAFYECTGLTSIVIPNSVTSIGDETFYGCTGLTSVDIPNSVTSIGDFAFYGCTGLTSIDIPNSVTSIGDEAFMDCSGLASINIGNAVTSIGAHAFYHCPGLTSIVVESGNPRYDSRNNCNAIIESASNTLIVGCKNTIIPNSVTVIGDEAFAYCSRLISIDIPSSVTVIGDRAFIRCWRLTSIDIPNSVTVIGDEAFRDCTGLTSIDIPNSVTKIGEDAFYACTGLTSIVIPNSVTEIGYEAFAWCTGLTDVYCYIADLSRVSSGDRQFYLDNLAYSGRTLHVLQGTADAYRADENWYPCFGQIVEDIFIGDVNRDLEVNIADVNAVIGIILGGNGSTPAADVNGDGEINIADVNALIDIILSGNQN